MRSRFLNSLTARTVALAACAGVVGSFAMAAPAMAAAPGGAACQASDGKISGRGSTLQANAMTGLINGYSTDVCGTVGYYGTDTSATDPAGTNMIAYNPALTTAPPASLPLDEAAGAGAKGSGEGLAAMACRTDAFGGTDIPYNDDAANTTTGGVPTPPNGGTMSWLWSELPTTSNPWPYYDPAFGPDGSDGCDSFYGNGTNGSGTQTPWAEPYTPLPSSGCNDTTTPCYPSGTNEAAPLMSFPIAVASAALGVDFKPNGTQISGCPTSASQVQLTYSQVAGIFGGTISNWDQLTDSGTSTFNWSGCNEPITRIVRGDISGTTQEMKTYLRSVDPTATLCDGSSTWTSLSSYDNNTLWPGSTGTPSDPCSGVTTPTVAIGTGGGPSCPSTLTASKGVICALQVTGGGITYGDLSNWKSTPDVIYADVVPYSDPSTGDVAVGPGSSATLGSGTPNCDTSFSSNTPGSGQPTDMVGLDSNSAGTEPAGTDWSTDALYSGSTYPSDVTNIPGSTKWPICTLTYDMVYSGLSAGPTGASAIGGLTADQRRTIYTFFAFALSPDGQGTLKAAGYLPIPSSWASAERSGFEANF